MPNLYEYIYRRGGARTCARSLAVRQWLAISPIGPEKEEKTKCSFALGWHHASVIKEVILVVSVAQEIKDRSELG